MQPVYSNNFIKKILKNTISIAVVGLSEKQNRPSYFAAKYLQNKGYKIIPINPITKSSTILNEKVYKCLSDIEQTPDMIDLFVKQDKIRNLVDESLKISPKTIWLQLGLIDYIGEKKAKDIGINFIMNKCPKIEFARLSGELGWAGINSNVISNQKILLKK
jgi:predicted CoA-binding protein